MSSPRIVSLIPSGTEIVCGLGFEAHLVGRSHECDFPTSVGRLPVCSEPKFNIDGSSAELDRRVKKVLQNALSVYKIHQDVLQRLQPDVIVTQAQCEVCAVSLADVEQAACQLLDAAVQVVSLEPNGLTDIFRDIERVAQALDAPDRGAYMVASMKERMAEVAWKARQAASRPTVACFEWLDPVMAAGNWMPALVEMAGGHNLFGRADEHSSWLQWENVLAADPEIIVLLPCGFGIERTRRELRALTGRPGWASLKAVRNRRVYLTDGNQYFNRPGPRLVESLQILAELFHPTLFHFGHQAKGWQPL
jgi:iron complex transport system substrate-binding protein